MRRKIESLQYDGFKKALNYFLKELGWLAMAIISKDQFHEFLMSVADGLFRWHPAKASSGMKFNDFKVIAHRGLISPKGFVENSPEAFKKAMELPIAGLEFDIRWTKDMEPVVFHDRSLRRLQGSSQEIHDLNFSEIRESYPGIPHLEEVLKANPHGILMMELKKAPGDWKVINKKLPQLLEKYRPSKNYYLISLHAEVLKKVRGIDPSKLILIAMTNAKKASQTVLEMGWGGLAGHYLMMSQNLIDTHKSKGQMVGVGFPTSLASLYREYNRGADFIFSDHAESLYQQHLARSLS